MKQHNKEKFVYLNISTWVGYGGNAQHYYGFLKGYSNNNFTSVGVLFRLTEKQAQKLNGKNKCGLYSKGEKCKRFFSEEYLIKQTKKTFKQYFPNAKVLVLGDIVTIEPQTVLIGPPNYKKKVNEFARQCEELGWWDGENEDKVEKIWQKWENLRCKTFPVS